MFKKIVIFILGMGLLNTGLCETPGESILKSSTSLEKQADTKEHKFEGDSVLTKPKPPLTEKEKTPAKATEEQQAGSKEKEEKPAGQTKANEPNKP